jgi:hypothetical protein
MDVRYARTVIIAAVITIAGGLTMRACARRMEGRLTTARQLAPVDTATGPVDSARAVKLALRAYFADHTARGEVARAARVTAFAADSAGFQVELGPRDGAAGARAIVRIAPSGQVELRRLAP